MPRKPIPKNIKNIKIKSGSPGPLGLSADNSRRWQLLILTVIIGWVVWQLAPVLMPFAIAGMLAYLGDPLVHRLERLGLGRSLSVAIVFFVIIILVVGAVLLLIPLISHQVENVIQNAPRYVAWWDSTAQPWLQAKLHLDPSLFQSEHLIEQLKQHVGSIGVVLGKLSRSGMGVVEGLTNIVLVPVVAFYLLRDWDKLVGWIDHMLPRSIEPTVAYLARESDEVLGAFVRGQLLVMGALGLYYGVALSLVAQLSVGPLIGMIAGLLSFVPYLGFIIGFASAIIASLVIHGDWVHLLIVVGIFIVGQLLEGYVLVPKLVGDKIGLHPVAVIFAVLAGGYLAGFLGVLIALPAASVILVLMHYLAERYKQSELYIEQGPEDTVVAELEAEAAAEAEAEALAEQAKAKEKAAAKRAKEAAKESAEASDPPQQ